MSRDIAVGTRVRTVAVSNPVEWKPSKENNRLFGVKGQVKAMVPGDHPVIKAVAEVGAQTIYLVVHDDLQRGLYEGRELELVDWVKPKKKF